MSNTICKIEGCDSSALYADRGRKGFCRIHYSRIHRHGDPNGGRTAPGDVLRFINDVALNFKGKECLAWPFSTDGKGYGQVVIDGGHTRAHRYICRLVKGTPPTPSHLAAHSCGKGHLGCVNPRHLSWKTHAENMADMVAHGSSTRGERHSNAKLTEENVMAIFRMKGSAPLSVISKKFSVRTSTVSRIHTGRRWSFLTQGRQA